MLKRNRKIELIDSLDQKKNTKCRRSKNLMKKCYELSVLCGLSINLIIYDSKSNKIQDYSTKPDFTHEKIHDLIYPKNIKEKHLLKRQKFQGDNFFTLVFQDNDKFDDCDEEKNWYGQLLDDEIDTGLNLNELEISFIN